MLLTGTSREAVVNNLRHLLHKGYSPQAAKELAVAYAWDEQQHPRDHGKFSAKMHAISRQSGRPLHSGAHPGFDQTGHELGSADTQHDADYLDAWEEAKAAKQGRPAPPPGTGPSWASRHANKLIAGGLAAGTAALIGGLMAHPKSRAMIGTALSGARKSFTSGPPDDVRRQERAKKMAQLAKKKQTIQADDIELAPEEPQAQPEPAASEPAAPQPPAASEPAAPDWNQDPQDTARETLTAMQELKAQMNKVKTEQEKTQLRVKMRQVYLKGYHELESRKAAHGGGKVVDALGDLLHFGTRLFAAFQDDAFPTMYASQWEEAKHSRNHGKFARKGTAAAAQPQAAPAKPAAKPKPTFMQKHGTKVVVGGVLAAIIARHLIQHKLNKMAGEHLFRSVAQPEPQQPEPPQHDDGPSFKEIAKRFRNRFDPGTFQHDAAPVTFRADGRMVVYDRQHDVSREARDESGEWTAGGTAKKVGRAAKVLAGDALKGAKSQLRPAARAMGGAAVHSVATTAASTVGNAAGKHVGEHARKQGKKAFDTFMAAAGTALSGTAVHRLSKTLQSKAQHVAKQSGSDYFSDAAAHMAAKAAKAAPAVEKAAATEGIAAGEAAGEALAGPTVGAALAPLGVPVAIVVGTLLAATGVGYGIASLLAHKPHDTAAHDKLKRGMHAHAVALGQKAGKVAAAGGVSRKEWLMGGGLTLLCPVLGAAVLGGLTHAATHKGETYAEDEASFAYDTDASGHEHRGKGQGGGQFVGSQEADKASVEAVSASNQTRGVWRTHGHSYARSVHDDAAKKHKLASMKHRAAAMWHREKGNAAIASQHSFSALAHDRAAYRHEGSGARQAVGWQIKQKAFAAAGMIAAALAAGVATHAGRRFMANSGDLSKTGQDLRNDARAVGQTAGNVARGVRSSLGI